MSGITRILIANRGEIAVRIIKACQALGIGTVVAVSEADRDSQAAQMADRVVCIGPARPSDSYLSIETIVSAALGTNADAVHPGYGFLAEKPEFAAACLDHDLVFIGPQPEAIQQMGNKIMARQMVKDYGVPVVPGSEKVKTTREALAVAEEVGFPILLKSAAGGGGRGMRIISGPENMEVDFAAAAGEARSAFGDATLYVERYIPNARHIEVQIIADHFGNVVHLGERDCSLQRRYQKVIEEAPAYSISSELRKEIHQAAVTIARNTGYYNAGTIEFLVDQDQERFYFLEMNTRIQVEHPVTEMVTGEDLVQQQIRVAAGEPLGMVQSQVQWAGHAIECRINAEMPEEGFQPCPGRINFWSPPRGEGMRVDTHCYSGYLVPPYYDSLLAKLIVKGNNRSEAIARMGVALEQFVIEGVKTIIPFLRALLKEPDYVEGRVNTKWIESLLNKYYG